MTIKYIQNGIILGLTILMTACGLDLEPENTYVDEKVYRNEKTALAAWPVTMSG